MIFSDSAQIEILETEEPEEKDNEGEELIDDFMILIKTPTIV